MRAGPGRCPRIPAVNHCALRWAGMGSLRKGGRVMWGLARATRIMAIRIVAALLAAVSLAGCRLDQEERLRAELAGWLDLRDTLEFQSRSTCTGAVFLLENTGISDQVTRATSVDTAIHYLRAGRIVAFELFDTSPTVVSEQIMTASLEQGLGLLSNGIGPAKRCPGPLIVEIYV